MQRTISAIVLYGLCAGSTCAQRSPFLDMQARTQELQLARSGAAATRTLAVRVRELRPATGRLVRLAVTPRSDGAITAEVRPGRIVLSGREQLVRVRFTAGAGAREGEQRTFELRATGRGGSRALLLRARIDERAPRIALGADAAGRPERSRVLAPAGVGRVRLRVTNAGLGAGVFTIRVRAPTGWTAGLPRTPILVVALAPQEARPVDVTVEVRARDAVPAGARARCVVSLESRDTGESAELELTAENGGHLHVPSATGTPRAHRVRPGKLTTWVAHLFPFADGPRRVTLDFGRRSAAWPRFVSRSVLTLGAEEERVLIGVRAPENARAGATGRFVLRAVTDKGERMGVTLVACVTDLPKTYFIAIDALNEEYLDLDARGTARGRPGDRLMPWAHLLSGLGSTWTRASANLPSATDMNHVNILAGSKTGTSGVPMVAAFYGGRDELGRPVTLPGSHAMLRHGATGRPVQTFFDAVRQRDAGARAAFVSGKGWVNDLLEDGDTLAVSAAGDRGPYYVGRPHAYVLGDPTTDADAESDPPSPLSLGGRDVGEFFGSFPALFPDNEFVMSAALEVILHEDPESMYVLLAAVDDVQHTMGNASRLSQWRTNGTTTTWDDRNKVNPFAAREEVLDEVRDADHQLGRLLQLLHAKGDLLDSYIVLTADHGQVTHPLGAIRFDAALRRLGISTTQDFFAYAGTSMMTVYGLDAETAAKAERFLERQTIVLNRAEMRTGRDTRTGKQLAQPDELSSEFWIRKDTSAEAGYRWPSLFVFVEGDGQLALEGGGLPNLGIPADIRFPPIAPFVGGHGGPATQHVPLVMAGPGIDRGKSSNAAVRVHDIVPTLYGLMKLKPPANVDGRSLLR